MTGTLSLSLSEKERHVQIQEARRLAQLETAGSSKVVNINKTCNNGQSGRDPSAHTQRPVVKKKYTPKGHDGTLKKFQSDKTPIFVESLSGDVTVGTIVDSDRYTISVKMADLGKVVHIYKHGIFCFGEQGPVVNND